MAARILRRIQAAKDAEAIADYLAEQSLETAVRFLQQAEATLEYLAGHPGMGGRYPSDLPELAEMRVWRISGFPNHLIFYIEHPGAIEVVRILHGAMDTESALRHQ